MQLICCRAAHRKLLVESQILFTKGTRYNNGGTPPGPLGYYGWPQGMNVEDYKVFMGYPVDAKIKPANANFSF